jgi:hypothetical protein
MRFLANENIPRGVVDALAESGHDIVWLRIAAPGMGDKDVLEWSVREERILLTFDRDFGELAWKARLPASCGVILFRLPMPPTSRAGARLAGIVAQRDDWAGHFSVVQPGRIRMRPLSATPPSGDPT